MFLKVMPLLAGGAVVTAEEQAVPIAASAVSMTAKRKEDLFFTEHPFQSARSTAGAANGG
jgi:hypothetical protein